MPFIEIHFKGRIGPNFSDWFHGLTVQIKSPDESCICGEVPDNSAIYGILSSMSSLGLTLISVSVTNIAREQIDSD